MSKPKVFMLVIFDIVILLWALFTIYIGFDEMYEMRNPYRTILILATICMGIVFIFLKIKNPKSAFKIYNFWFLYFILLWLAYELITFAYYEIPSTERMSQLIRSIYFDGLISFLYPFLFSYILIIAFLLFTNKNSNPNKKKS